jgi:hypothetical protein
MLPLYKISDQKCKIGYATVIGIYAPGEESDNQELYEQLQTHVNSINKHYYVAVRGDFNASVGNQAAARFVSANGEEVLNESGKYLGNFTLFNELKTTSPL